MLKELGYDVERKEELIKYRGIFKHKYIRKNKKDVTSLEIPAIYTYKKKEYKIVEIADNTFEDCELLENIKLPETITRIGNGAFRNCKSLKNIKIPDGVKYIGGYAFKCCSSLIDIKIPDSVIDIGCDAFYSPKILLK